MEPSEKHVGVILLAASLAIVFYLYLFVYQGISIYDVDLARAFTSLREYCTSIDYHGRCNVQHYYSWFLSRIAWSNVVQVGLVCVAVVTSFVFAFKVFGSWTISGLTALLYVSIPAIFSGLRSSSMYYISMLIPLAILLLYIGIAEGAKPAVVITGLILYALFIAHPAHFAISICLSALLIMLAYRGADLNQAIKIAIIAASLNVIYLVLVISHLANYYTFAVVSTLLLGLSIPLARVIGATSRASYKDLGVIAYVILSASILALEVSAPVVAVQTGFNPVEIWGLPGLLGIAGALLVLRRRAGHGEHYLALLLFIVAPFTLFVHVVVPFFATISSILASRLLKTLYEMLRATGLTSRNLVLNRVLPVLVLSLVVVSAYASSLFLVPDLRSLGTPFGDLTIITQDRDMLAYAADQLPRIEESLSRVIRDYMRGESIIVISTPENAPWISSVLSRGGARVVVVATPDATIGSRSLIARILTSEELPAVMMLRDIAGSLGVEDIFVILTFPYSERVADKTVYLGVPREAVVAGMRYPVLVFDAYGDIFQFTRLLDEANKTRGDYLQVIEDPRLKQELARAQPLFWTIKGSRTLLNQLVLKSFEVYGVKARNYNIGFDPEIAVQYFELIHSESLELGTVNTVYYGTYKVYYMISVFKLRGGVSGTA